jgi:DNA-binding protein HU-beta
MYTGKQKSKRSRRLKAKSLLFYGDPDMYHENGPITKEELSMNKAELTAAIVKKTGFTKKDAEKALGAVTESITAALAAGEKVQVVGFGSFEVRKRPARVARNPRTGEQIKIAASKAPVFKAGKALKESVNKK